MGLEWQVYRGDKQVMMRFNERVLKLTVNLDESLWGKCVLGVEKIVQPGVRRSVSQEMVICQVSNINRVQAMARAEEVEESSP